jgi:toxin ParE1/3/4
VRSISAPLRAATSFDISYTWRRTPDLDTADRFLANAERCFNELADRPEMGSKLMLKRPELAGLRKWRVPDFENFLVFYLPRSDGISLVRVLYAARDWWSMLGMV